MVHLLENWTILALYRLSIYRVVIVSFPTSYKKYMYSIMLPLPDMRYKRYAYCDAISSYAQKQYIKEQIIR
jgi:hypothetical protein